MSRANLDDFDAVTMAMQDASIENSSESGKMLLLLLCFGAIVILLPSRVAAGIQLSEHPALDTSIRTVNWDSLLARDTAHFEVDTDDYDPNFGFYYRVLKDSEQSGYLGYSNYEATQFADLNRDGREDAIVVLWNPGSGAFATALIFLQTAEGPKYTGCAGGPHYWDTVSGDTVDVVTADWLNYGQEAQCCPSAEDHQRIVGDGDTVRYLPIQVQPNWGWPYWKVELFYEALNDAPPLYEAFIRHEFNRQYAYSMLSPSYRASHPYSEWLESLADIRSVEAVIDEQSPDTAVRVAITSVEDTGGQLVTKNFERVWHLKQKSNTRGEQLGDWELEMQEIPKQIDTPAAFPRIGMSDSELHRQLYRSDFQPNGLRSEFFFNTKCCGTRGDLEVRLDSSERIDSLGFSPDSALDTGLGTTMLRLLRDSLGSPFEIQQSPEHPGTVRFAWQANSRFSYVLDTDKWGDPQFRTAVWDTSLTVTWDYHNTRKLGEVNLNTLATARFREKELISYLRGKCLHVSKTTKGPRESLSFSPVFVCGIPGTLWTIGGRRWPLDSLAFPSFGFRTALSFIRAVADTVSQRGRQPAFRRIRTDSNLTKAFSRCFSIKYPRAIADTTRSIYEVGPIRAYLWSLNSRDPGFRVLIRDSISFVNQMQAFHRLEEEKR